MELFFAKLLGIYFIIIGTVVAIRRRSMMPVVGDLIRDKALLLVMSVVELAAGIALVLAFPAPSFSLSGVFSVIGYMMILESVTYLVAPTGMLKRVVGIFNRPAVYVWGGLATILLGMYFAAIGFELFI